MLALVAPGQGAQTPGMLEPWIQDPAAKLLVQQWSHEIGLDLVRLGTTADAEEIKDTANAQPLIVAAGLLGARALNKENNLAFVAGHSVGEITAAALAGVINDLDAMKLVRARGIEMAKAAAIKPAGMAAVLGGDREVVLRAIADLGLVAANDNGAGQIVAAGDLDALSQLAPEGARVRALAVAGAFHTSYMEPAVAPLRALAASLEVQDPKCGVISNKDGAVIRNGREILDRIVAQISNPVRWDLCMTTLTENVSGALEVPPAGTLVGLLKRAAPIVETFALKAVADLALADEFALRHNQEVSN
ncbi:[acyl-carrier-protein] S-malonyltransferase [Candidatus Planktophila lacus]|jgi:[acyl-carrier-protein] S-malonyltransferase|uniref:ACP S-malonyltransferase n=1 Tax=Candidatus Planktophila lacus TaxID=1884913 RepID=UPI000BAC4F77|nr:ACP S-malonyltransferase [Candidatus Planktophila lacus]ASY28774.1 [acyl-carrier-protein] S-malonyltransferase [Candidatus Planktophila lacus]